MATADQVRRTGAYVPPHLRAHEPVAYGTRPKKKAERIPRGWHHGDVLLCPLCGPNAFTSGLFRIVMPGQQLVSPIVKGRP